MFKAGVLSDGEFKVSDVGVPQGSICSAILANIFAHYVIDEWVEITIQPHCRGKVKLFRYADDAIICCEYATDAERIRKALPKRLGKYKLILKEEKTKTIDFSKERVKLWGATRILLKWLNRRSQKASFNATDKTTLSCNPKSTKEMEHGMELERNTRMLTIGLWRSGIDTR